MTNEQKRVNSRLHYQKYKNEYQARSKARRNNDVYINKRTANWRKPEQSFKCLNCAVLFKRKTRKIYKYCSSKCQAQHQGQHKHNIVLKKKERFFLQGKLTERKYIYQLLVLRDGNKCSVCKIAKWNKKPIRFWVDHIDGHANNSKPGNFRLICPNCDSQSDTFGSKNRGNGRKSLGMKMYD